MNEINETPSVFREPSRLGAEISVTGKWVPRSKGSFFRKSKDTEEMSDEWKAIHEEAKAHPGVLSTEINFAIGQEAILVHHVFANEEAFLSYFSSTASAHQQALLKVAQPEVHLIRGLEISDAVKDAIQSKGVKGEFGSFSYGYVKNDYKRPEPKTAIQVTAKWTCLENTEESYEQLKYWWSRVGQEAHELEKGLVRFEVFEVEGEKALIIHETFEDTDELQFHLSKGTAHKYKKDIDKVAAPEAYFFRGPVSWMIRTYSKFMKLPATYTRRMGQYSVEGGNMSDGLF